MSTGMNLSISLFDEQVQQIREYLPFSSPDIFRPFSPHKIILKEYGVYKDISYEVAIDGINKEINDQNGLKLEDLMLSIQEESLTPSIKRICFVCNKDFDGVEEFQKHCNSFHKGFKKNFNCEKCGKRYINQKGLDLHRAHKKCKYLKT
jgi:hypothetical protein